MESFVEPVAGDDPNLYIVRERLFLPAIRMSAVPEASRERETGETDRKRERETGIDQLWLHGIVSRKRVR